MLIAAAVCPHPPLLIPAATGPAAADSELARLRTACHQSISAVLAEGPDLIAVIGADAHARPVAEYPPDAPGRLHDYGVPFTIGPDTTGPDTTGPDTPGGAPALPLSLTVGKWLLSGAAGCPPAVWWGIAPDLAPAPAQHLGEKLAARTSRVGLLVMGDGPGRRARAAPEAADPAADRYDDQVAGALATADPAALAALDPGQDVPLVIAGRAAWQVLAGAAGQHAFAAELLYRGAPFEVSYYVASWSPAP